MLLMATSATVVTAMTDDSSDSVSNRDFQNSVDLWTENAELRAHRMTVIEKLTATYGNQPIFKSLQQLINSESLWSTETLCVFVHDYGLRWVEEVDSTFNHATGFYYDVRFSANQWDQSTITSVDIPCEYLYQRRL